MNENAFFYDAAEGLLCASILLVAEFCPPETRHIVDSLIEKKDLVFEELSDCFPEDSEMSEERLTAVLNSFLRKSKPRNADLFLKRYYFQNTVTSIADEYGIRENHVRSILSKMRKRLKTEFAKEAHNDG